MVSYLNEVREIDVRKRIDVTMHRRRTTTKFWFSFVICSVTLCFFRKITLFESRNILSGTRKNYQDKNLITRLEGVLKTDMSSVAFNWTSENAVDGNIGPDPEQCLCCSGTTYSITSWWTVDLGKMYPLEKVYIYSRESENKFGQLQGFLLFLRNSTEQEKQLHYDDSTSPTTNTSVFNIFLSNVLARLVTIQKSGVLTICEVEIYEGDCMIGTFGEECSKQCHCADNRKCDRLTGQCSTPVCKIGWIGTACDTKCKVDTFGENCREKCHCADNTTCTIDYGICPDNCRKGYFGIHCNKVCPDGAFGTNCNDKCFCDGNGTCSKDEGICPGECIAGYTSVHCNIAEKKDNLNKSLIIGVSASGGGAVIVAIILGIVFCRRRLQNRNSKSETNGERHRKSKTKSRIDKEHIEIKSVDNPNTQSMDSIAGKSECTKDESRSVMDSCNENETEFEDSNSTTSGDSSVISQDTLKSVKSTDTSNDLRKEPSIDSREAGVKIHTQETGTTDIYKQDSMSEAERFPDEKRYVSVFESDNIYQYYNLEIKRQIKKYGVEESELEEENYYDPVGEPGGTEFNQTQKTAGENISTPVLKNHVIQRDNMNKVLGKLWEETAEVIKSGVVIMGKDRYVLEKKFEIITSEASFLKSINVFIDVFMMSDVFQCTSSKGAMVNKQQRDLIFSNVTEIRKASERFLEELESHWNMDIYLPDVCKIVAEHAEHNFECYVAYCGNQHRQIRTIEELRQTSKKFEKALSQLGKSPACQQMDIQSFILLPMQRITRLNLLTESVYKKTTEKEGNNEDIRKVASHAHKTVSKVTKRCNRAALEKQGEDDMKRAVKEIEFLDKKVKKIPINDKKRFLVREKDVTRILSGQAGKAQLEELHLYIFNDIAVFTKKRKTKGSRHMYTVFDYCELHSLKAESIVNIKDCKYRKVPLSGIPEGHDKFILRLIILENHEKEQVELLLSCKDRTDRDSWTKIIAPIADCDDDQKFYTDHDFPLVRCIKMYTAQNDEELSLVESDKVKVKQKEERTGMYYGERLRDLEEGWFPKVHTEEIKDEHVLQRDRLMRYRLKQEYGEDD